MVTCTRPSSDPSIDAAGLGSDTGRTCALLGSPLLVSNEAASGSFREVGWRPLMRRLVLLRGELGPAQSAMRTYTMNSPKVRPASVQAAGQ